MITPARLLYAQKWKYSDIPSVEDCSGGEDDETSRDGKISLLAQRNKDQLLRSSVIGNPL